MKPLRVIPVLVLAGLLPGCASYVARELSPAATQAQWEGRRLDDPGLVRFLAARGQGETGSWSVPRLTLAAFYFRPEMAVARARLAEAEAGRTTAAARPNPTFTFTPGRSDATAGGVSPWILGYAVDLPLEWAGKRGHRIAEAGAQAEAARCELAAVAWATHAAVRRAVVDWRGAEAELELWRAQLPRLEQLAQLVAAQLAAGDTSALAAAQARTALARAGLAARASERAAVQARGRLAEAMGVPPEAVSGLKLADESSDGPDTPVAAADARSWAARNRADLLSALARYAAAQAALQSEVARQFPNFSVGPGYQLDQGTGKWSLALGVSLPVFQQNQGPIAAAEARRSQVAAEFVALQNRALAEVDRAAADHAAALDELAAARGLAAARDAQTRILRAQWKAGETSRLELARAEIDLAELARLELAARQRAALARGVFEDAVQRPLAWPETAWRSPGRETASP